MSHFAVFSVAVVVFREERPDQLRLGPELLVSHVDLLGLGLLLGDGLPRLQVVLVLPDLDGTLVGALLLPRAGLDTQKIQPRIKRRTNLIIKLLFKILLFLLVSRHFTCSFRQDSVRHR